MRQQRSLREGRPPREVVHRLQQERLGQCISKESAKSDREDLTRRTVGSGSLVCDGSGLCGRGGLFRWSSLLWRGWGGKRATSQSAFEDKREG